MKNSNQKMNPLSAKVLKYSLSIGLPAAAAIGYFSIYNQTNKNSIQTVELSSKKPTNSNRPLDLGQVTKQNPNEEEAKVVLNDPALSQAWGIKKSDAERAWNITQGSKKIVVAVIDTGADIYHEDLQANIWENPGETGLDANGKDKATNGIDDDGNGFVDDVHGWNFVSNDNKLTDNHGHGTHIAGIIGAEAGNGKGIAGIAPQVSLMVLKYFDPKVAGTDNLKNTINSIRYAVKMGANIINYSGGGTEYSQDEKNAIEEARKAGILFVAAAGNERSNSDQFRYYPADYGLSNIISVTAIDPRTQVLPSSNYGTETVDIAAPGQNILSTLPNSSYGQMTGTSQATAFVSGAAVLVMARHPSFSAEESKKYILATGDSQTSLVAKTRTARQLNLYKALTMIDSQLALNGVRLSNAPTSITASTSGFNSGNSVGTIEIAGDSNRAIAGFGKSLMQSLQNNERKN